MRLLGIVVGAFVWPLLAWAGTATTADSDRPRQVLLLYAESRLLPAIVEADAAFRSTVASRLGAPKIHRSHMTHKMKAGSVAELVAMAQKLESPGSSR